MESYQGFMADCCCRMLRVGLRNLQTAAALRASAPFRQGRLDEHKEEDEDQPCGARSNGGGAQR